MLEKKQKISLDKLVSNLTLNSWQSVIEDINNDVLFAGKPLHTIRLLRRVRIATIISSIVIIPSSVILMFYLSPLLLSLNMAWIFLFAYPKIQQTQMSQDRKKKVEEELPTFIIFAAVMQSVGINIYDSFQLFSKTLIFKAINGEALLLKRNVEVFGLSQIEALENLGHTHKSMLFTNLLLGYTSIWRSGGDLTDYLESRADELFVLLKEKYQSYSNNVGSVIEVLVTLLVILPILIMVVSFVLPGSSIEQITLLASIGLPLFAVIMGIIISSVQPSSFNVINMSQKIILSLFGLGLSVGMGLYFTGQELWLSLALGFIVPCAVSAVVTGRQTHEIKNLESALPQFLRDVTEYKKIGYDVLLAIIRLSQENSYNSKFDKKLKEVGIFLEYGIAPTETVKDIVFRSWMTRVSFFILAYISEYGGGSPKVLETITRFITNTRQSIREGVASISVMTLLIFVSPVIMVATASMIQSVMGGMDSTVFELASSQDGLGLANASGLSSDFINVVTITPEFLSMIKILIVMSSIMGAFVIGKAIDFTFYNTWRVVAIGLITIISIMFMDNITTRLDTGIESLLGGLSFG